MELVEICAANNFTSALWRSYEPVEICAACSLTSATSYSFSRPTQVPMQVASVLVACVFAAMTVTVGLGGDPALRVPRTFDFPLTHVPLCVVVGFLCGAASVVMAAAARSMSHVFRALRRYGGLPAFALPPLGGLACGALALACPEITYQVCLCLAPCLD